MNEHEQQVSDLQALTGGGQQALDRRTVLKGLTVGGFAMAANPVLAQAITTPSTGLQEGRVLVPVDGDEIFAQRVRPVGVKNPPVILVVQEIFGIHAYIEDVCRRLAQAGFYAIAPELFSRHGDPGQYGTAAEIIQNVVSKVPDSEVMSDLDRCVEFAAKEGANTQKLAITGFCWGGRITWLYSAHNPAVKAGVAWYGRLVGPNNAMTPKHAVDIAANLKAPVLGLYGAEDTGIPLDTVERMRAALKDAAPNNPNAAQSTIEVYPGAQHGFHADYRPTYNAAAAKQAYNQALQFLRGRGLI